MSKVLRMSVASVYPHYVAKVEKKGRTKAELDQVICWLTGFDAAELSDQLAAETTLDEDVRDTLRDDEIGGYRATV